MEGWLRQAIPNLDWLGAWVEPTGVEPACDPQAIVSQALAQPIGALPLASLLKPGKSVALVVDDYTRQTQAWQVLPGLLTLLDEAGVAREKICLVIASGSHRRMSLEELSAKLGQKILEQVEIYQTADAGEQDWILLGGSSSGIPARIHCAVVEADLRIGLGMITPHMDAGFSGGAKIILPGVCAPETVDAFHAHAIDDQTNPLGNLEAPLRLALESFVQENLSLDWLVNLVLTPQGQIFSCVAGHPILAHRAGARHARQVYGAPVRSRFPVVVANCAPYQQDLWQSLKGLWCGDLLVQDGGTLIWVTQAPEGLSRYPHLVDDIGADPEILEARLRHQQVSDLKSAVSGVLVGRMKQRFRLVLVSSGLCEIDARRMGIVYHTDLRSAIQEAVGSLSPADRVGCVAVIPQAGVSLPILQP